MNSLLCVAALLCIGLVRSQVVFQERRIMPLIRDQLADQLSDVPVWKMPKQDNDLLLEESKRFTITEGLVSGPYRFAKSFDAEITLDHGQWFNLDDGSLAWMIKIESMDAYSLSVVFNKFRLPEDSEFYIRAKDELKGPYTAKNNKDNFRFSVFPLQGDSITLEYYSAPGVKAKPLIQTSKVAHGFKPFKNVGESGKCNINVACDFGNKYKHQIQSVAMVLTNDGEGFCSGAMINNAANDGRQLFLTAFHCVDRSEVDDNILAFNYHYSSCNGTGAIDPSGFTAQGLKRVAEWRSSDFALLELQEEIPTSYNVYLAGWSISDESSSNVVGIHHPMADAKKMSISYEETVDGCWGYCNPKRDPLNHWKVPKWSKGTTEPGSSGSPLFDGDTGLIVGQLHGGSASCYNEKGYDMYGKLHASYGAERKDSFERLAPHLDPTKSELNTLSGVYLNQIRRGRGRFLYQNA